jgi:hypothetical protein
MSDRLKKAIEIDFPLQLNDTDVIFHRGKVEIRMEDDLTNADIVRTITFARINDRVSILDNQLWNEAIWHAPRWGEGEPLVNQHSHAELERRLLDGDLFWGWHWRLSEKEKQLKRRLTKKGNSLMSVACPSLMKGAIPMLAAIAVERKIEKTKMNFILDCLMSRLLLSRPRLSAILNQKLINFFVKSDKLEITGDF